MRAPNAPLGSPISHLKLAAGLQDILLKRSEQALQFRSEENQHSPPRFIAMYASDVCVGIEKVTMQGVLQAVKKVKTHEV